MYNPAMKEKFIAFKTNKLKSQTEIEEKTKSLKSLFNKTEKIEMEFEIDFGEADFDILVVMLNSLLNKTNRVSSRETTLSRIKEYTLWYNKNVYFKDAKKISKIKNLKSKDIVSYNNINLATVSNEDELIKVLEMGGLDTVESNTIDVMYRVLFLLIFSGVRIKDLKDIKVDGFNYNANSITVNERTTIISNYCKDCIKKLISLEEIVIIRKDRDAYKSKKNPEMLLSFNTKVLNEFSNRAAQRLCKIKNIYNNNKKMEFSLTLLNIKLSGIFYRTYQNEIKNIYNDEILESFFDENIKNEKSMIKIKREYSTWKQNLKTQI